MLVVMVATNGEACIGIVGQQQWLLGCYDWLPLLVNSPIPGRLIGCYYLKLANPQQLPTLATVATTVLANG